HPSSPTPHAPRSFPTRRSSDLLVPGGIIPRQGDSGSPWGLCRYRERLARKRERAKARVDQRNSSAADDIPFRAFALSCFRDEREDRKSTRLNSSHVAISYAVFC